MHPCFFQIKAVGFDLDRTLYPDTLEMNERIAQEVFKTILRFKPELETIERVREIYQSRVEELQNWAKVLKEIGVENCQEVVSSCLNSANIVELIKKDDKLVRILEKLQRRFFLFLITRSTTSEALRKLAKIGIRPELFQFSSFENKDFQYFLLLSPYQPREHVYIGDNVQTDIILPKSLGMKTVVVGKYSNEADVSVASIHEIERLLL